MDAVRAHKKNERKAPIRFPSFVYRQDGHEQSYKVFPIIRREIILVKPQILGYNNHNLEEVGGIG